MTLLSALTTASAAFAGSLALLGVARFVSGATAAAIVPLSMAFVGDHVPYQGRQAVLARFLTGTIMGLVGGQVLGGTLGELVGWRAVFVLLGGLFLLVGALLALELRSARVPTPLLSGSISPAAILRGYRLLLGRSWARVILLTVFVEGFLFYGAFAFIGAYLHARFALGYAVIGLVLAAFGLGGLIYAVTVRRLIERLGERGLALGGGLVLTAGLRDRGARPARVDDARDHAARPRHVHAARDAADPCDADGARGARPRGLDLRQRPVHRPGGGRLARRPGDRPDRLPAGVPRAGPRARGCWARGSRPCSPAARVLSAGLDTRLRSIHIPSLWMVQWMEREMVGNVQELRPKTADSEKITINLGYVDLGHIDLMVQEGFYSNRTDFIRTAIRNQIERHADVVRQSVARKSGGPRAAALRPRGPGSGPGRRPDARHPRPGPRQHRQATSPRSSPAPPSPRSSCWGRCTPAPRSRPHWPTA